MPLLQTNQIRICLGERNREDRSSRKLKSRGGTKGPSASLLTGHTRQISTSGARQQSLQVQRRIDAPKAAAEDEDSLFGRLTGPAVVHGILYEVVGKAKTSGDKIRPHWGRSSHSFFL